MKVTYNTQLKNDYQNYTTEELKNLLAYYKRLEQTTRALIIDEILKTR
jgi:hypothetical protein